ncbi:MAG: SUMF1/EgtB/PvdO family nonheme iron enzyme [Candidatus Acidiferrales bacterium]
MAASPKPSSDSQQFRFVAPEMARIPEGWFAMGCDAGRDDERPAHRVWVDGFEMARCQVTNAEYAQFLAATGRAKPLHWEDAGFNDPRQPVAAVSWFDAMAYCEWLSGVSGCAYFLPSEAQWERGARGGAEGEDFPWGNVPQGESAESCVPDYTARWKNGPENVGLYAPNAYGLYNMGDNVHEWCADWYDAGYYARSPDRNPRNDLPTGRRASRGGSWRHHIKFTRTAARSSIPPEFKYADYGFRVAREC